MRPTRIRDFLMDNFETMPLLEVQKKAERKNKDLPDYKDACCEMIWRSSESELMLPEHRGNQVEECAWQDFWFERAADAGHIDAKGTFARSLLIERVIDKEYREKAFRYYQSLSDDFDAGKLIGDDWGWGPIAKLWLGIMLCEGYYIQPEAIKGVKLIKEAEELSEGFRDYGYKALKTLGELYATGLAQPGGDPSIADLVQAGKYLVSAINRFNPEKDDPNNRGYLNFTKHFLEKSKEQIEVKKKVEEDLAPLPDELKKTLLQQKAANEKKRVDESRDEMLKVSPTTQLRLDADKAAVKRLRERLEREGY